jgi:uncharacterized protein YehS (DUF1456 family)
MAYAISLELNPTMTNNDILRRIRYVFDFNDAKMMAIFALADVDVRRGHIIAWLVKDEDPTFEECKDHMLAAFLNGLITEKRGKKDGPAPEPERKLSNNIILMKLKIALNLQSEGMIEIAQLGGFTLSAHELSSFMRRPGHRNHRECKDQVLRNFLTGLQIKLRKEEKEEADKSPTASKPSLYGKWDS